MRIEEVIARRTDLSTFLVHLARDKDDLDARQRLKSILTDWQLKAGDPRGHAISALEEAGLPTESQKCVCFTETPLEHVALLTGDIEGRACQFGPYGVAITKRQGRKNGVNPVWYVDISPGHDWLSNEVNELVGAAVASGEFDGKPIAKLTPFIEQMGSGQRQADGESYRKEFWWEREWRKVGDLSLPNPSIVLCPEDAMEEIRRHVESQEFILKVRYVDPSWSLEQIIARLARFNDDDVGPF